MAVNNTELELELILSQMAQKPMLRGEVGARALRVRTHTEGQRVCSHRGDCANGLPLRSLSPTLISNDTKEPFHSHSAATCNG